MDLEASSNNAKIYAKHNPVFKKWGLEAASNREKFWLLRLPQISQKNFQKNFGITRLPQVAIFFIRRIIY